MLDREEFHEQFDRFDFENVIGRYVENCFGQKELVTMPKLYWDYFDWVKASGEGFLHTRYAHDRALSAEELSVECSRYQRGAPLSSALELWVDIEMKYRRNQKLPEPHWIEGDSIADIPSA